MSREKKYVRKHTLMLIIVGISIMTRPAWAEVQAHWSFDAAPSGGKYADNSGKSNDITITTAPFQMAAGMKFGAGALDFDAAQQHLLTLPGNAGESALPITNRSFSVSIWIKRQILGEHWAVAQGSLGTPNTTLHIGFRGTGDRNNPDEFSFGFWSDDLHHPATPTDLTTWHHYAMSYDASSHRQKLVIDGAIANAETRTTTSAGGYHFVGDGTNNFWIGCRQGIAGWFDGMLDEVWVMSHVLSNNDILHLYHNNSIPPVSPGSRGVLAHWSFDEPSQAGAHVDSSGRDQTIWDTTAPTHVTSDKAFGTGALDFEADNSEYLTLGGRGASGVLGLQSNSFTISFWVKRETNSVESFVISQGPTASLLSRCIWGSEQATR